MTSDEASTFCGDQQLIIHNPEDAANPDTILVQRISEPKELPEQSVEGLAESDTEVVQIVMQQQSSEEEQAGQMILPEGQILQLAGSGGSSGEVQFIQVNAV